MEKPMLFNLYHVLMNNCLKDLRNTYSAEFYQE